MSLSGPQGPPPGGGEPWGRRPALLGGGSAHRVPGGDWVSGVFFFSSSRVLGLWRTHVHYPTWPLFLGGGDPWHIFGTWRRGIGGFRAPNFGGAAPGFKLRTACMRVRSRSHDTMRAARERRDNMPWSAPRKSQTWQWHWNFSFAQGSPGWRKTTTCGTLRVDTCGF